jgi:YD repeat-containing protein
MTSRTAAGALYYTPRGELVAVYDHSNTAVRSFTYDDNTGRMVAHHHAGGRNTLSLRCYRTVVAQHNPAGLSYAYAYEKTVSPSPTV